ncbi:MAG: SufD family Fe-S cluster assembly protein [Brevinema sp.]
MKSLVSYFEPFTTTMEFPSAHSEEYRYSKIVDEFSKISVEALKGRVFDLPNKGDYTFFSDQQINLPKKSFHKLPKNYHRHENYFKQASLVKDNNFYELTCTKSQIHLDFASSVNSVLTEKLYLHVPAEQTVQIYLNFYSEEQSLSIPMIYIDAQENSHVELIYTVDQNHNKGIIAPLFELIAAEKSHVSLQSFTEGIARHRLTFIGFCDGADSHIDLRTGFLLREQENCDLFVRMYHEAENSTSNQMIKTTALDSSQMNFNGLIYADGQAHNIYAYQMLKGIILGDKARILARPQLDIEYFELACSHGVSIGGFDPEELFYLKSRGIQSKDIYPLLLYGFFSEPFIELPLEEYWINRIKNLIKEI